MAHRAGFEPTYDKLTACSLTAKVPVNDTNYFRLIFDSPSNF